MTESATDDAQLRPCAVHAQPQHLPQPPPLPRRGGAAERCDAPQEGRLQSPAPVALESAAARARSASPAVSTALPARRSMSPIRRYDDIESELRRASERFYPPGVKPSAQGAPPVVLRYRGISLTPQDIATLCDEFWITDEIVAFFFKYYKWQYFRGARHVKLVKPAVTFFLMVGGDAAARETVESLALRERRFVLFPVNDSIDAETAGGIHWSLLVFDSARQKFLHFDSLSGFGARAARALARLLAPHLANEPPSFAAVACPQQQNLSDCGIFMIEFARHFLAVHAGTPDEPSLSEAVVPAEMPAVRRHLLETIVRLLRYDVSLAPCHGAASPMRGRAAGPVGVGTSSLVPYSSSPSPNAGADADNGADNGGDRERHAGDDRRVDGQHSLYGDEQRHQQQQQQQQQQPKQSEQWPRPSSS